MKLEGELRGPGASRRRSGMHFMDPSMLKKAIPGCEKLEAIGPDEYKATMKIGIGGVKGTFEGKVRLSDKKPTDSYKHGGRGLGRSRVHPR